MASTRIVDHIGRVLGNRYRLLAPIGTGASAHVFLAEDVSLRRRVAVKILHPALADDQAFLRRFRAEAQAAAALNHANVMSVYDWGEEADGPYLVCEFLGGGSLQAMLDRGHRLTPSQALLVGLEAARGLDYAHRRGLVHRDVKPANLLFDDDGRLRIADFGLARALAEASWTEPSGTVLGTARYAAPEQALGGAVDGKADVYSLAIVLVEVVTGRLPFTGDTTIANLLSRVDKPLDVPIELGPLRAALVRAGRADPAERPDAVAFGAALQAAAPQLPSPDPLPLVGVAAFDDTLRSSDRAPTELGVDRQAAGSGNGDGDGDATSAITLDATVVDAPGLPPDADRTLAADDIRPVRRRRRWWKVALVLLLLLGAGAGGALAWTASQAPTHALPVVVNRSEADAVAILRPLKFDVEIRRVFIDGTSAGQVTDQVPQLPPGRKLKEGSKVVLTVSKGPTPVPIPDLEGLSQDQATEALAAAGLTVGVVTPHNDENAPAGQVLDWSHKGTDTQLPKGSAVDITVSSGPAPRVIPDVEGMTYEQAVAALAERGLTAARAEAYSDAAVGSVIGTNPRAGREVRRGTEVTVTVSRGQPVVPDLKGLTVPDATARLEAVGLKVGAVYGPAGGKVFLTTPAAGTKAKQGDPVSLFIL